MFESDLRNEPAVRERVERSLQISIDALADTIARDTGLGRGEAELLSCGLAGLAEVSARWWLASEPDAADRVAKDRAIELLAALAWRGISGYPRVLTRRRVHDLRRHRVVGMEVRIGVKGALRELSIDTTLSAEELESAVDGSAQGRRDDAHAGRRQGPPSGHRVRQARLCRDRRGRRPTGRLRSRLTGHTFDEAQRRAANRRSQCLLSS